MTKRADAVIVAAGTGERSGLDAPKQFFEVNGKPVLFYTIKAFCDSCIIKNIAVVLPCADFEKHADYMKKFIDRDDVMFVRGGKTRMESVMCGLNALESVKNSKIVCIHDGVRPFVTSKIIEASIDCAEKYGAALTAVGIVDTVKLVEDGTVKSTCDRNKLFAAQTPQTFAFDLIMNAYKKAAADGKEFTDDCAVAQYAGETVKVTGGSRNNIKLTTPEDFLDLELKLR